MLSKKIIKTLFFFLALISLNAQATVNQFQDSFEGSFFKDTQIDPILFSGSTWFFDNDVDLSTTYEIVDLAPDFYFVFGTFTRADTSKSFYGSFEFSVQFLDPAIYPDYWSPYISYPFTGNFSFDNNSYLPDGELYEQNSGWGEVKGLMNYDGKVTFTIDWTVLSGLPVSNVPEPLPFDLICFGLVILEVISLKHRASRSSDSVHLN